MVLVSFALIYQTFISLPPSTTKVTMNMFGYLSGSSLKTPWKNIISNLSSKMIVYQMNVDHVCTVSHKQSVLLHKNSKNLSADCYLSTGHMPGIFLHLTQPTTCNLVVDDFGAKMVGKHNAEHLINKFKNTTTSLLIGIAKFSVKLS